MSSTIMGMYADTVESVFVRNMCPIQFDEFMDALTEAQVDLDDFARELQGLLSLPADEIKEVHQVTTKQARAIAKTYSALRKAFKKKVGLGLFLVFHDEGNGGDELDGEAWALDGVYI